MLFSFETHFFLACSEHFLSVYVLLSTCPYGELSYQEFMDGGPDNKAHKSATKAAKERDSRNPKTIFGGGFVVVVGHN